MIVSVLLRQKLKLLTYERIMFWIFDWVFVLNEKTAKTKTPSKNQKNSSDLLYPALELEISKQWEFLRTAILTQSNLKKFQVQWTWENSHANIWNIIHYFWVVRKSHAIFFPNYLVIGSNEINIFYGFKIYSRYVEMLIRPFETMNE